MRTLVIAFAAAAGMLLCARGGSAAVEETGCEGRVPTPPPMPQRSIFPAPALPGQSVEIQDGEYHFTLFLPNKFNVSTARQVHLRIHFHSAIWHAIQDHLRGGLNGPLICFYPGEGSSVYQKAFSDKARFGRWLRLVEAELKRRGAPDVCQVTSVDITSFSAGYGAVRELVKGPAALGLGRRVVLLVPPDGSYAPGTRTPAPEHSQPWVPLAREAMSGRKTFTITHSQVPTATYANSEACASAILKAVGVPRVSVPKGSCPATTDPQFPLLSRGDKGCFHVWGYGGTDGQAHMTHARHLGDVWNALDAAGEP